MKPISQNEVLRISNFSNNNFETISLQGGFTENVVLLLLNTALRYCNSMKNKSLLVNSLHFKGCSLKMKYYSFSLLLLIPHSEPSIKNSHHLSTACTKSLNFLLKRIIKRRWIVKPFLYISNNKWIMTDSQRLLQWWLL